MTVKTTLPDLHIRLSRAVENNELVLHYQPQVDLKTGEVVAAEALVRWKSPELGLVPPNDFIPLAEESGLIIPIGEWVLKTACREMVAWQKAGHPTMAIAVNLSARQFQSDRLVESIDAVLRSTQMDPKTLDLEITETYAMQNVQFTITVLKELKERGMLISIDDFGTGYSSLMHLLQFPIDTLKIDRFFIRDLSSDPRDAAIATAIITLAHNLGLQVVAEGVETEDQRAILCREGCDRMQGYLFSRPLPAAEFEKLIQTPPAISVD